MKKITLLIVLCFASQFADAQNSCAAPVAINSAGLYVVGIVNGTAPTNICAPNGAIPSGNVPAAEWYAYTPTQDHTVTVTTSITQNSPLVDTRVHVYIGACDALTCYAGDDDSGSGTSSLCTFNVTANVTYTIAFDNRWISVANNHGFTFQLIENPVVPPLPTPVSFTAQSIPTISNAYYNNCAVDMNNDYRDDLVSVSGTNIRINFQNIDGTFTVRNIATTQADNEPDWSISAGDYNRDGYNDLLYGSGGGLTLMKSGNAGTTYTEYSPGQSIFCQRTNFVDINNDGNLDAFSCHDIAPNVYYLNDGHENFTYYQSGVTAGAYSLGITPTGGNYASLWTDLDNDGDLDMFISKCSGPPCEIHRNDGNGVFTDISAVAAINVTPIQSWSSAIADFDNDGDMDILIGANGGGNKLFKNNLDTSNNVEEAYSNITAGSGFDVNVSNNRDYIAYDFDNDGFLDIMGGGNKIMFNNGNMTFTASSYPGMSLGSIGDFNNDGFLDIQNGNTIFKSQGNVNKWITLNLEGVQSNRNGIGARVEIYGAWGKQIRDVRSGEGFEYMSTLNPHFGIGTASTIDKVVVRWPSGTVDELLNPSSNQVLKVIEGTNPPLAINQSEVSAFSIYPNPAFDVLNIKSNNTVEMKSAAIFDLNGKQFVNTELINHAVEVKTLASGAYILVLKDAQGNQYTQKFLKK
jgi:hypothetical protein